MKSRIGYMVMIASIAVFVAGLYYLLCLRLGTTDTYPPYSSLRSDPLGTKALYLAMGGLETITAERNYIPLSQVPDGIRATWIIVGVRPHELLDTEAASTLARMAAAGSRIVIALYPDRAFHRRFTNLQPGKTDHGLGLSETWGITIGTHRFSRPSAKRAVTGPLPSVIDWHSPLHFVPEAHDWIPIYTQAGVPVIVERQWATGSVVLCADSYIFSNEGISHTSNSALFAWLVGPNSRIFFDESHLGIQKTPSVMGLILKYRFHGFLAGCLLLMILFVWKSSRPFMPPLPRASGIPAKTLGMINDTHRGMMLLLKRHIPVKQVLTACVREWKKTIHHHRPMAPRYIQDMDAFCQKQIMQCKTETDVVNGYQAISQFVQQLTTSGIPSRNKTDSRYE